MASNNFYDREEQLLLRFGGVAALVALAANLLDVILGFGDPEPVAFGSRPAVEWFWMFQKNWFKGLYTLGILNIVYMTCMVPVVLSIFVAHCRRYRLLSGLALITTCIGTAIYISNSAAIPMFMLSEKFATATTDLQRASIVAAGEAVLAAGEDFTPGSFVGMFAGGLASIVISYVLLRGGLFRKTTGWIGIIGFSFLSIFTITATFLPVFYGATYYLFGMIGGMLALAWFFTVANQLFRLSRIGLSYPGDGSIVTDHSIGLSHHPEMRFR